MITTYLKRVIFFSAVKVCQCVLNSSTKVVRKNNDDCIVKSVRCWEHSPSFTSISADLWWGVRRALSGPGRSPRRHKAHSTSHPTPVVSHYNGGTQFVRAWLIPSEGPLMFELVKQRQMSLSASSGWGGRKDWWCSIPLLDAVVQFCLWMPSAQINPLSSSQWCAKLFRCM